MCSLWRGSDHLLYVKGSGFLLPFSEEYQRFRYADIRSLVMARTSGTGWGAVGYGLGFAAAAAICFAMLFFREPGDVPGLVLTLALPFPVALAMLALLVRHVILGPRCAFEVQTAVKRERLLPVGRLHQGRELLALIDGLARQAQAALETTEADREVGGRVTVGEAALSLRIPGAALPAFLVQSFGGILLLALLHVPGLLLSFGAAAAALAGAVPLLMALAGSVRHPCPQSIRQALWVQMAAALFTAAVAGVFLVDQAISDPAVTLDMLGPFEVLAEIGSLGGFAFYLIFLGSGLATLGAGLVGIASVRRWRARLGPRGAVSPRPPESGQPPIGTAP